MIYENKDAWDQMVLEEWDKLLTKAEESGGRDLEVALRGWFGGRSVQRAGDGSDNADVERLLDLLDDAARHCPWRVYN